LRPTGAEPNESLARQIAHRLINSRRGEEPGGNTAAHVAAAACDHLYGELSRWVGADGCHALFTRARTEALTGHPALAQVRLRTRSEPYVDGVAETARDHGDAVTAKALEAMLIRLIDLLRRLIGDDVAVKLIERTLAGSGRSNAVSESTGEEA
jgi:hypothetical protein